MDVRNSIDGSLQISNEVVAKIAKLAALEIDGVADVSSGSMQSVRVKKLPGAEAGTVAFLDPQAVKKWESSGAPFRLQDSDIVKLTEDYSIYGYMALGTPWPDGILPVVKKAAA